MADKPVIQIPVVSVSQMTISDPAQGALVKLETEADADLELVLSPTALVELEALLARAAQEQAKRQPRQ